MLKRPYLSLYWICQLIGWGAVMPYWLYYELNSQSLLHALVVVLAQAMVQIFMTDQYRRLVHKMGWLRLPLSRLLPIVFIAWLFLIAQYMLMTFTSFIIRYEAIFFFQNDVVLGAVAGGTRYMAIWLLGFHLYHFARQSSDQAAAAAHNARLATEAQLAKLSNELNPHFLFNALNGIKALTREDPARSRLAIDRLAELLRYSLRQSERKLVPLAEELYIIKEYVALEQMRLEERLQVTWDLGTETDDCQLPPLSLHTLVENAIKHGINSLPEGGTVNIRLESTPTHWQFSVKNDGLFDPRPTAGSGLTNLRSRLKIQYQGLADFDIFPFSEDGLKSQVIATLNLPK